MKKKSLTHMDVRKKKVLVRVDFNVPLDISGNVTNDLRIRAALPTIQHILDNGGSVILMSHLGRPKSKPDPKYSLSGVSKRLAELLGRPVRMAPDCVGADVEKAVAEMRPGEVLLLENLRFHAGEEANNPSFADALARLGDLYVNDAFGTAHRAHASVVGVPTRLPSCAGFLLEKEIDYLSRLIEHPERPFAAVLGGAKVSDKITVVENLLPKLNTLLIGGGMAYTFLAAEGRKTGNSKVETDRVETARQIISKAKSQGIRLLLPDDHVVTTSFEASSEIKVVHSDIPDGWMGVDIGPKTIEKFATEIKAARTVFWNGPVGVFEDDRFAAGSHAIAKAMADSSAITIVGGGDTASAVEEFGMCDEMSHVSTGGGASLEFLEGKELPGIAVLPDA